VNPKQNVGILGGYLESSVNAQKILVITRRRMMNPSQEKYLLEEVL
jgi:hypothetical protein